MEKINKQNEIDSSVVPIEHVPIEETIINREDSYERQPLLREFDPLWSSAYAPHEDQPLFNPLHFIETGRFKKYISSWAMYVNPKYSMEPQAFLNKQLHTLREKIEEQFSKNGSIKFQMCLNVFLKK